MTTIHVPSQGEAPPSEAGRYQRLAEGIRQLRVGTARRLSERTLMALGGVFVGVGFLLVLLGWRGAATTPYLYEQIPYMASGGFFGVGLIFCGAFCYFAHWVTELVKEHRVQSAAIVEAIARLEETVRQQAGLDRAAAAANGSVGGDAAFAPAAPGMPDGVPLVATARGTMAHRPDCVVVTGKGGLRQVQPSDGLLPCKLCDPYAVASSTS